VSWRSIPTSTAWLLLSTGIAAFIGGWQLGWVELFVLAAACLVALVIAVPFILGHSSVTLERSINPNRVTVGDRALAEMRATNAGSRPSSSLIVEERIAGMSTPIEVPSLRSGQAAEFLYNLPTEQRGAFDIGPATVSRGDPLGLLRRSVSETRVERLWVHPRYLPTKALPAGFAKDLEGPTFDTSPAGDIAFHAIREYQRGDDVRHVHWMSTARKGTLMVRHYVDNRRPQVAVVVDHQLSVSDAERFELALEVAASIGVSALTREAPLSCWVGSTQLAGIAMSTQVDDFLDRLSLVEADEGADPTSALAASLQRDAATSVMVFVTSGYTSDELLTITAQARRETRVIVVNLVVDDRQVALPRTKVLNISGLQEFASAWDVLA